jgi:hypothetical protein
MALTVDKVAKEALRLPLRSRVRLVEELLDSLAGDFDPATEKTHLDEIRERRKSVRSGKSKLIDGATAMKQVRAALRK